MILSPRPSPAVLLSLVVLWTLTGCGGEVEPGVSPPLPVTVTTVKGVDTPIVIEFFGKTTSSRRVEIRSRVDGFLEKRLYTEGEMVEEGQPLFQIDTRPFEAKLQAAEAELAQQQALLQNAKANLNRVRPLAKQNAVAKKELDDALGTYRTALAAVAQAEANRVHAELDLGYTTITSPVKGISSFASQGEGAYIGIGAQSLLTYVAQIEPMWVEFSVSENQILRKRAASLKGLLQIPDEGSFEVQILLADDTVYPHKGRITFADASLSEETGTFLIRAEIANPDHLLRPGQFVRARLLGAVRPQAILLPQRAVQQGGQGSYVWVVDAGGRAELRPVEVGPWHEEGWFIDAGLHDGDRVVVDGAVKLRADAPVTVVESDREIASQGAETE